MTKAKRISPGDGDPRHGTHNGYQNLGCRGPDCTAAKMAYERQRGAEGHHEGDRLLVTCWCEDGMVFVRAADVRAGRTGSCGKSSCRATVAA